MVGVRVLAAGLMLLAAGCAVLGWGSRSRQTAANDAAQPSAIAELGATMPSQLGTEHSEAKGEVESRARSLFAGLPLIFEPNRGQGNLDAADPRAKFVTRGSGYSLFLGSEGAILSVTSRDRPKRGTSKSGSGKQTASQIRVHSLEMKLAGANPNPTVTGADLLPGKSNYFLGNDPAKWRTAVPQFARVRYENIYPGINLVFYGNQGRLEYDFQVAPGSNPGQAELEFNGAKKLELKDGALVIKGEDSSVQFEAPRVYQEIAGRQQAVEGRFVLRGANRAGFAIGSYDHSRELVIDPILTFSTYFGGSGDEGSLLIGTTRVFGRPTSVAVDGNFNIYLAGSTTSPNLPTTGTVFQPTLAAGATQNVYIAKIEPPLGQTPAQLLYVTYLGGDGTDTPVGIGVDGAGDAFVAGTTTSNNFPTSATNAYQIVPEAGSAGTQHVFVTKLKFDATVLLYSSYLSGNGNDIASGMTIDASGFLYVTGTTTSGVANSTDQFPASTLPFAQPFQSISRAAAGVAQFFVTKVNPTAPQASSIDYSTYFGGGNSATNPPVATGGGIAVDTNGNMYFTGTTNFTYTGCAGCSNTDFPILNAYQPCLNQPPPAIIVNPPQCTNTSEVFPDAFVAKLNPNANQGQQLIWSTYLGGSGTDLGAGVALDTGAANVYIVGTTNSIDIGKSTITVITSAPFQACLDNQFVAGSNPVQCTAVAGAPNDAFVARLTNPTSSTTTTPVNVALNYFSYLGGGGEEAGLAIAVDSGAGAVVTGWTQSTPASPFPVSPPANPIQSALTGFQDAFFARLNTTTTTTVGQTPTGSWASYFGGNNTDSNSVLSEGTGVTLDVNQNAYFAGDTNSPDLQVQKPLVTAAAVNPVNGYNGGYDSFVAQLGPAYSLSIAGFLTQGTNQQYISAGNPAQFTYLVTNNGPDLASELTLTDDLSSASTGVTLNFVSASVSAGTCGGGSTNTTVSCSLPPLQSGSAATVTIVVTPLPTGGGVTGFNGGSVQVMGPGNIVQAHTSVSANMSDFKLAVTPPDKSVPAAGDTATYQVVLTPLPVYGSPISLACTGLPPGAACNFSSGTVTLAGPGTSTLNITTTARPVTTIGSIFGARQFYAIWLAIPGLTLLGVGAGGDRRRRRMMGIFFAGALFALLLLQPACSTTTTQAPVSGTPAGTYKITVTATSDSDTKSGIITLTVP
ncbi:MAG TPA: SBBP repeat-containing protein [Candidatus Binatus sp.]|nr:SBBP repeat-containing protein [Candidatus Binatus sp.]